MGNFSKRFNKDATKTNALKITTDLGLCCDEDAIVCEYSAEVTAGTAIEGITIGENTVTFPAPVTDAEDVLAAANAAMLDEGYVGAFSLEVAGTGDYTLTATAAVEIVELIAGANVAFVQKCTEAIVCDFKINYRYSETEVNNISYDNGATFVVLPFGNFATQTPATVRADIEPTLPPNVSLETVVKNEILGLFELVFHGEENTAIIMNGDLGETIAEKCNCAPGWIASEEGTKK